MTGAPVSHAKPALPDYAPVSLHDQVQEVRRQLAITRNVMDKKLRHDAIHPVAAALELQCLQGALHTLETIEQIVGRDAVLTADELRRRLVLQPGGEVEHGS